VLEPTKPAVLTMKKQLDAVGITHQDAALQQASGHAFYNTSPFTLRDLRARARTQQLKADFEAYLEGFSPNVQEILDKFHNQIPTLIGADNLGRRRSPSTSSARRSTPRPMPSPKPTCYSKARAPRRKIST
jgi:type I restriction enzyme M protein